MSKHSPKSVSQEHSFQNIQNSWFKLDVYTFKEIKLINLQTNVIMSII